MSSDPTVSEAIVAIPADVTAEPASAAASPADAGSQSNSSLVESAEPWVSSHDVAESPKLTPRQITALKCLTNGDSIQDAALTAHVNRSTVWRWLTEHAGFRAAYNRWKAAAELSARSRLVAL